jgi:DnaJ-class molecular chaperone
VPVTNAHGDLLVTVEITVPKHLSSEQKEAVSNLGSLLDGEAMRSAAWGEQ